jgi:nicotinamidase-related amidase
MNVVANVLLQREERSAWSQGAQVRRGNLRKPLIPASGAALVLIDVINDLSFPGADALVRQADGLSKRLAALKRRAVTAGVPVVYVNDNFGRWRSDFRQTVSHCTRRRSRGRRLVSRLRPTGRDYFVLKPMHSGFFGTSLDVLLSALEVRTVILTGIAGNICVLFTANDAYMRRLRILAPADCIVSNTARENTVALVQMASVMKADTRPSTALKFR